MATSGRSAKQAARLTEIFRIAKRNYAFWTALRPTLMSWDPALATDEAQRKFRKLAVKAARAEFNRARTTPVKLVRTLILDFLPIITFSIAAIGILERRFGYSFTFSSTELRTMLGLMPFVVLIALGSYKDGPFKLVRASWMTIAGSLLVFLGLSAYVSGFVPWLHEAEPTNVSNQRVVLAITTGSVLLVSAGIRASSRFLATKIGVVTENIILSSYLFEVLGLLDNPLVFATMANKRKLRERLATLHEGFEITVVKPSASDGFPDDVAAKNHLYRVRNRIGELRSWVVSPAPQTRSDLARDSLTLLAAVISGIYERAPSAEPASRRIEQPSTRAATFRRAAVSVFPIAIVIPLVTFQTGAAPYATGALLVFSVAWLVAGIAPIIDSNAFGILPRAQALMRASRPEDSSAGK